MKLGEDLGVRHVKDALLYNSNHVFMLNKPMSLTSWFHVNIIINCLKTIELK